MTQPYFNTQQEQATTEHQLLEDLIDECVRMFGIQAYIIPREEVNLDLIYGEDPLKKFTKNFGVSVYMTNVNAYSGAGNFFSKFGLEIRDDTTLVVSRRAYMKRVPVNYNRTNGGPREGDLIWIPLTKTLFETKSIEEEKNFFALGRGLPYYYELTCERYRYSNEKFVTGLSELDEGIMENAYLLSLGLTPGGNGIFIFGETVYMSNTQVSLVNVSSQNVTAVVQDFDIVKSTLNVAHTKGSFTIGTKVWGANSNASYVIASFDSMMDIRNDDIVDNRRFENEANVIVDFSVNNPFGAP